MKMIFMLLTLSALSARGTETNTANVQRWTITYSQFKKLTPAKQQLWLESLQKFYSSNEALKYSEQMDFSDLSSSNNYIQWILHKKFATNQAQTWLKKYFNIPEAQASESCQVTYNPGKVEAAVCLTCPATAAHKEVKNCTTSNDNSQTMADDLFNQLNSNDSGVAISNLSKSDLAKSIQVLTSQKGKDTSNLLSTSLTNIEVKNKSPFNRKRELGDSGDSAKNADTRVQANQSADKLSCIFAGWPLEGSGKNYRDKCIPLQESPALNLTFSDGSHHKVILSCKKQTANQKKSDPEYVFKNNKTSDKALILCNPLVFGVKNDKPICIKATKQATSECKKLSDVNSAVKVASENPELYAKMTRQVDLLCQGYDQAVIRMGKLKRKASANSIQDLMATCSVLQERMSELEGVNQSSANSSSQ